VTAARSLSNLTPMKKFLPLALLLLTACASDATKLTPATYADLAGWNGDHQAQAFQLFTDSCHMNATRSKAYRSREEGPVGVKQNWATACATADTIPEPTDSVARQFFEANFIPYHVTTDAHPMALMTGYYEPLLHGSRKKHGAYLTPVYGVPRDLVKPYFTRAEIDAGLLRGHAPVLLYVDDPIMLFFLQVQGSGKVQMDTGELVGLQYAAQNGHEYVAIGKILRDSGELDTLSLETIRDWLLAHPDQADAVMEQNPSYIFFKISPGDQMAKGALGIPLTPLRSLAVDDDRAAYGVPTYVDTTQPEYQTGAPLPLQRLFVSQDTGGALHGPHRGDIFYGRGPVEEWQAGHQQAPANVYWLLPVTPAPASIPADIDPAQ